MTDVKCQQINEAGIVVVLKDGKEQILEVDTVVVAVGAKSDIKLWESIKEIVPEIYLVGDCVEPRRIRDAVSEGHRIGMLI